MDFARRKLSNSWGDSDDESPLSQTDNTRPRSSSADLFASERQDAVGALGVKPLCSRRSINDRIHGHIEMEPVLVAVMDTPQFQVCNAPFLSFVVLQFVDVHLLQHKRF